jgi:hypothetical protein
MISLLCGFAFAASVLAQDAKETKIDDVKTPPSPAFVLLGVAPSDVEKPTTPRALATSILSAVQDSGSGVPKNFALDVAPYWLVSHPALTREEYIQPSVFQSLRQTLSVSIATAEQNADAAKNIVGGTVGGAGVRAAILLGKPSKIEQQIEDAIGALATNAIPDKPVKHGEAPPPIITDADIGKLVDALRDSEHEGRWFIEGAVASSTLFLDDRSGKSTHQKSGIWITPSYRMQRSKFDAQTLKLTKQPMVDFVSVFRWLNDHTSSMSVTRAMDIGGRLIWDTGTYSFSAEHLLRRSSKKNTHRTAAVGEFKVSDNMYITATLGKDFKDESSNGGLISILGVHFAAGQKPLLAH